MELRWHILHSKSSSPDLELIARPVPPASFSQIETLVYTTKNQPKNKFNSSEEPLKTSNRGVFATTRPRKNPITRAGYSAILRV